MVIMLGFESGGPGSNLCQRAIKELTNRNTTAKLSWVLNLMEPKPIVELHTF